MKYILKQRETRSESSSFSILLCAASPAESSLPLEVGAGQKADVNIEKVRTASGGGLPPRGLTFPQQDSDFSRRGQREIVRTERAQCSLHWQYPILHIDSSLHQIKFLTKELSNGEILLSYLLPICVSPGRHGLPSVGHKKLNFKVSCTGSCKKIPACLNFPYLLLPTDLGSQCAAYQP